MPNKTNIDTHLAQRCPGATTTGATNSQVTVQGNLDAEGLKSLIHAVDGSGGSVILSSGALVVKY